MILAHLPFCPNGVKMERPYLPSDLGRYVMKRRPSVRNLWEAFKTFAILFSFTVNFVLVLLLLIGGGWLLFPAKTQIVEPLLLELQGAVNDLGNATIVTQIPIDKQVPIQLQIPLEQDTVVTLQQDVPLATWAVFQLPGGGGTINGTVSIKIPAGTQLPVRLKMTVPVSDTIRVQFPVDVRIPLRETELNLVVVRLNRLLTPYVDLVQSLPDGF